MSGVARVAVSRNSLARVYEEHTSAPVGADAGLVCGMRRGRWTGNPERADG